jgi:hypothetical protein
MKKEGGHAPMSLKRIMALGILLVLAQAWANAQAGARIFIGFGRPYYRPYPYRVYVAPGPVYLAAPVYVPVQPAPVIVQSAPVAVQSVPFPAQPTQPLRSLPPQPELIK